MLPLLKEELDKLLKLDVVKRVPRRAHAMDRPYCLRAKEDHRHVPVRDLTLLNEAVLREQYTVPAVDYLLGCMAGAKVFSKLVCMAFIRSH